MTERTYPYKAWVLQPSFKPVEIELVENYRALGASGAYDRVASGKLYRRDELYPTKEAAVAAGLEAVKRIEADLDKRRQNLNKKRQALDRAAASNKESK